jgi:ribosome-associated protein
MLQIPHQDLEMLTIIGQAIYDKKGANIITLDLRNISTMTDFCIIAEGNVEKHVQAIAEHVNQQMTECHKTLLRSEGKHQGDWVVLDYGHILVHLFIPDMREKYELEHLWHEANIVPIQLKTHSIA